MLAATASATFPRAGGHLATIDWLSRLAPCADRRDLFVPWMSQVTPLLHHAGYRWQIQAAASRGFMSLAKGD